MSDEEMMAARLVSSQTLEYTARALATNPLSETYWGPAALIAAAYLRLLSHTNRDCLATFEASLLDPEQPLLPP